MDTTLYLGYWTNVCSYANTYNRDGTLKTSRWVRGNDFTHLMLLPNNQAVYIIPNGKREYCEWYIRHNNIFIKKEGDCPYIYENYPILKHTELRDTLLLETRYVNKYFKSVEEYLKLNVKLDALEEKLGKLHKEDYDFALKKRFYEEDYPRLAYGFYNEETQVLYLHRVMVRGWKHMSTSPVTEWFVISEDHDRKKYYHFVAVYNETTEELSHVNYIDSYSSNQK